MKARTNRCLIDGNYICPVAFPQEYAYLDDPVNRHATNEWLGGIDMRLARLNEDGAFFMAPIAVLPQHVSRIRDDFVRYRDTYGPYLYMLQFIRDSSEHFNLAPGEFIHLATLMQALNESSTLDTKLRNMHMFIRDAQQRLNQREMLRKMLDHLRADGYLVLVNPTSEIYQTTGKIDQIKAVLHFLAENSELAGVEDESKAADDDLFDGVGNGQPNA